MARLHSVPAARKARKCGKCGGPIEKGSLYYWFQFYKSSKQYRCSKCRPRGSELINSDKLSRIAEAQEMIEDAMDSARGTDDIEEARSYLESALQDAAQLVRDVGEDYGSAADGMEQAFPNGSSVIDDIREKADQCEAAADEWEGIELDNGDDESVEELCDRVQDAVEGADLPS